MNKLFGTDGIRCEANVGAMRPESILKIAMATGRYFMKNNPIKGDHQPTVVIGKDTRLSGYMVESALQAGFLSVGMNVLLLGPLPTPAIALLTRSFRAQLGVMISASHNPAKDNGLKFFGPDGYKLKDEQEKSIEDIYLSGIENLPDAAMIGKAKRVEDAAGRYLEFVKGTVPRHLRLDGLKIVVDCAHGSAYKLAPRLFWELGADVITMHAAPTGLNINDECGATHTKSLQDAVIEHHADIGFALDGDADRLIAVDKNGHVLNGDQIIAAIATMMQKEKKLQNSTVVVTQMSNLGLERYLNTLNINVIRSPVGDRYVLENMKKHTSNLGGEQSGHIILSDYSSTGDALIASLQILKIMVESQKTSEELSAIFKAIPQRLVNVKKDAQILTHPDIVKAINKAHNDLKNTGRLFIRPSGTEPLIRIMVEAEDLKMMDTTILALTDVINSVQSN